jgi:hypothetical protein
MGYILRGRMGVATKSQLRHVYGKHKVWWKDCVKTKDFAWVKEHTQVVTNLSENRYEKWCNNQDRKVAEYSWLLMR